MKRNIIIKQSLVVFLKLLVPLLTTSIEERQTFAKGFDYYLDRLSNIETHQGLDKSIKIAKATRTTVLQYLGGNPIFTISERVSIDKTGLPNILGPLKILIRQSKIRPRIAAGILTILYVTKVLTGVLKPDYTTITNKYTGGEIANLLPDLDLVMSELKLKNLKVPTWTSCHLTIRSGPSGEPAMMSSLKELGTFKAKYKSLLDDLKLIGGQKFIKYLEPLLERVKEFDVPLRRLAVIPDKEVKSRIIGLGDYWSQTVLKPIHDHTMGLLKNISTDGTWDQAKFTKQSMMDGPYYSYDLKSATDRFPISFQREVMSRMYNEKIAKAWENLLVTLEFSSNEGPKVFSVGQPLGLYSSWSVFSLSHHLIVAIAAKRAGKGLPFTRYLLLGDDIMIADKSVAIEYKGLMDFMGVEISQSKSIISDTLFCFASRYFLNKQEISPFTFTGLNESLRNATNFTSFLQTMVSHGWTELSGPVLTPGIMEIILSKLLNESKTRFMSNVRFLFKLPLQGILVVSNDIKSMAAEFSLSCFDQQNPLLLKDYVLTIMRKKLIESLPALHESFAKWKLSFPSTSEFFQVEPEFEPFNSTLRHDSTPWANAWSAQHKHTMNVLISLQQLFKGEASDTPFEEWISSYRTIMVLPKPESAFKARNHVVIVTTNASIIRDVFRFSRRYSPLDLYHQVQNPFEEQEDS